jgi:hypothetical protein
MLRYKAAYRMQFGSFFAEVLDFPEATGFGATLAEARNYLFSSLRYAAERRLKRGEMLPIPVPDHSPGDAYLVETVTLLPTGDNSVTVEVTF